MPFYDCKDDVEVIRVVLTDVSQRDDIDRLTWNKWILPEIPCSIGTKDSVIIPSPTLEIIDLDTSTIRK